MGRGELLPWRDRPGESSGLQPLQLLGDRLFDDRGDVAVRRAVYRRDGGRCRFVDAQGRRCPERHRLEFHHRYPFALGGGHDPGNICLMCPAHNRYLAELDYGRTTMSRHQRSGKRTAGESSREGLGATRSGRSTERDIGHESMVQSMQWADVDQR